MDLDVIEGMKDVKYPIDEIGIRKAVEEWPVSVEYTKLVEYLTKELQHFCDLDEHVNSISCIDDSKSFLLEISSFLKELGCPYKCLTEGNVSDRLKTCEDRYKLLDFLITELLAARIISVKNPKEKNVEVIKVSKNESATAASLKKLLLALKISKPPSNVTTPMMFARVQSKVKQLSSKCISEPLFSGQLSEKQWNTLAEVNQELHDEYSVRRQLLIKRLDVTMQSFQWSERIKGREKEISGMFGERRQLLMDQPDIRISDILAARACIAYIEKTSNSNVRRNTQSSITNVIIGRVTDRGGRPCDYLAPPPPEMPIWAPRASQPIPHLHGGGERGGRGFATIDRGGRMQGGWRAEEKSMNHGRGRGHHGSGYQGRGVGHAGCGVRQGMGHPGGVVGPGVGYPGVGVAHPCVGVGPSVGHPCVGHPGHPTGVGHPCVGHPGASFHGFPVPRNYPSGGTYQNLAFQGGNVYQPSGFYPAASGPARGFHGVSGYQNVGYQGNTRYSLAVGYHQSPVSYHGGGVGAGTARGRARGRGRGADIKHTY